MELVIWKYTLKVATTQDIEMPNGAQLLSVQGQGNGRMVRRELAE